MQNVLADLRLIYDKLAENQTQPCAAASRSRFSMHHDSACISASPHGRPYMLPTFQASYVPQHQLRVLTCKQLSPDKLMLEASSRMSAISQFLVVHLVGPRRGIYEGQRGRAHADGGLGC